MDYYFDKNIKPEEKIAGFDLTLAGDDTFALQNEESYPGKIPEFFQFGYDEFKDIAPENADDLSDINDFINPSDNDEVSKIEEFFPDIKEDKTYDENFISSFSDITDFNDTELFGEEPPLVDEFKEEDDVTSAQSDSVWDIFNEPQVTFEEDITENKIPEEKNDELSDIPEIEDLSSDNIEKDLSNNFDEDFINMLKDDLAKSKTKKSPKTAVQEIQTS